jgi:hypothetical protein
MRKLIVKYAEKTQTMTCGIIYLVQKKCVQLFVFFMCVSVHFFHFGVALQIFFITKFKLNAKYVGKINQQLKQKLMLYGKKHN